MDVPMRIAVLAVGSIDCFAACLGRRMQKSDRLRAPIADDIEDVGDVAVRRVVADQAIRLVVGIGRDLFGVAATAPLRSRCSIRLPFAS